MHSPTAKFLAQQAAHAAKAVARLSSAEKNRVLQHMANTLRQQQAQILAVNEHDLNAAREQQLTDAMIDRLALNPQRIEDMASAIETIIELADPVGEVTPFSQPSNGIKVSKMRIPLGVICMIYEARPNVTADAGALCFKAGNAVILRCGREAIATSKAIAAALHSALQACDLPAELITVVPTPDRSLMLELLQQQDYIDLVIPRGGEGLIRFVSEHSKIPVIQHYKGVCHLYVDRDADLAQALALLVNGKTQRSGVCNALEGLLVHQDIAGQFLPIAAKTLAQHQVVIHADSSSAHYFEQADVIADDAFGEEYLALEIAVRTVPSLSAAIDHIDQFGSGHTEVIVTKNQATAEQFIQQVDSAVTMHNASSRFSDGGQLGLGAEIGISTSKLHAYGPMGLSALTTEKFVVRGEGQVRT
jgi:glutamate-5-semialdehyde dehydrogenase